MAFDFENNTDSKITLMSDPDWCKMFVSTLVSRLQPGVKHETCYSPDTKTLYLEDFWPFITHYTRQNIITEVFKQKLLLDNITNISDCSLKFPEQQRYSYNNKNTTYTPNGELDYKVGCKLQWDISSDYNRFFDLVHVMQLCDQYNINRPIIQLIVHHIEPCTKTKAYEYINHLYYLMQAYPEIMSPSSVENLANSQSDMLSSLGIDIQTAFKKELTGTKYEEPVLMSYSELIELVFMLHDKILRDNKNIISVEDAKTKYQFISA